MKPREFWLLDSVAESLDILLEKPPDMPTIHVRQVMPIDWAKISMEFDDWLFENKLRPIDNTWWKQIQQLVEAQLSEGPGEE